MERAVAAAVRAAAPDLLFVCLGSPRQEAWIAKYRPPCLALGLGGALDVFAGDLKRAPEGVRQAGFEWLWRAAHEPKRLVRLLALPAFAGRVLLSLPKSKKATLD
jgi:N-acetylglucosaminyldiphosphoundecaprenol N-acetyl-beta-D-mannosaminyltransferase